MRPDVVACDLHPGFGTTLFAQEIAEECDVPLVRVQHHHAHLASLAAEQGISEEMVCLTLDGVGYGTDGNAWGGEVLAGNIKDYERVVSLSSRGCLAATSARLTLRGCLPGYSMTNSAVMLKTFYFIMRAASATEERISPTFQSINCKHPTTLTVLHQRGVAVSSETTACRPFPG